MVKAKRKVRMNVHINKYINAFLISFEFDIDKESFYHFSSGSTENISEINVRIGHIGFSLLWWHKPVIKPKNHWAFLRDAVE